MRIYSRKMKTTSSNNNKNLDVFDFKPDDDVTTPNPTTPLIHNFTLAATGKSIPADESNYVPSLDIDTINMNYITTTLVQSPSAEMMADSNDALTVVKQQPQSTTEPRTDESESEDNVAATSASSRNIYLKSAILDLSSSYHEPSAHKNGSMCERSSSSDVAEDDGGVAGPSSDHCIDWWDMDSEDMTTVALFPDYVIYRGSYYTDEKGFKCKWGYNLKTFHVLRRLIWLNELDWCINDLIYEICLAYSFIHCSGTELKFSIVDSSWYERLEAILSLNIMYKALWTSMLESDNVFFYRNLKVIFGSYFGLNAFSFVRPFEEVVYPKGDADAVSISKRDFDLLQPDTFVNDTIIDFYIKYLKNKIKPDEERKLHFFNSFFFRKLADPDKDPIDASKGAAAYQCVKKWTRKINLFEKDYVFIPVNYNYHWSLIVMCHLGEVATYEDEDVDKLVKVPCVLHMDSLRGSHTGLQGFVQSYLKEEWKARQHVDSEDISSRFDNLRFISLELPQQQNLFDCGLFLLHYVELFLEQAPVQFNPFKVSESFNFLNVDWFVPAEASLKRVLIQKLIRDLLENPNQEPCSTAHEDQQMLP
ncbi:putative ubiquitin-like-specific protease 2B, partial [Bidens hawaiensis]|uniref:putative ubiquitin-like-specific protease 2B n=1 Tax=Bidens hawaiensis TaxID=980011 RepID=UPI00404A2335